MLGLRLGAVDWLRFDHGEEVVVMKRVVMMLGMVMIQIAVRQDTCAERGVARRQTGICDLSSASLARRMKRYMVVIVMAVVVLVMMVMLMDRMSGRYARRRHGYRKVGHRIGQTRRWFLAERTGSEQMLLLLLLLLLLLMVVDQIRGE